MKLIKNNNFNRRKIVKMMKNILNANSKLINTNIFFYEKERKQIIKEWQKEEDTYINKMNEKYLEQMKKNCEEKQHYNNNNACGRCHECNHPWYWEKFANDTEKKDYATLIIKNEEKLNSLKIIKSDFTILQLDNESDIFLANYILECMFFKVMSSQIKNESFTENHIKYIIPCKNEYKKNKLAEKNPLYKLANDLKLTSEEFLYTIKGKVNKDWKNSKQKDSIKNSNNSFPFEIFAQDKIIKIYPCILTEKGNIFLQEKKHKIWKWIWISLIPICALVISIIALVIKKN